jgi:hypothetical protein
MGGDISLKNGASLRSPALTQVNSISACEGSTLHASSLAKVFDSLWVGDRATVAARALAHIGSWCSLEAGATFEAPSLAHIGGGTTVGDGATFDAPNLNHVSGDLRLKRDARFTAQSLSRVDGALEIHPSSLIKAPHLHDIPPPVFADERGVGLRPPLAVPTIPAATIGAMRSM